MLTVIDRIEGKIAVIELPERAGHIEIPKKFLPKGIKEGNFLEISFKIDKKAETKQKEKIRKLQEKLRKK